jgi:hypothetical protein
MAGTVSYKHTTGRGNSPYKFLSLHTFRASSLTS